MFTFQPVVTTPDALSRYAALFLKCFPGTTHLNEKYLEWLYARNPAGPVVGMDAMVGDVLAAHYVCIPAQIWLGDEQVKALLSLNTATHPDFQGKGLFTTLAQKTYELGASQGARAVYGVANANSTPGFLRKLGFHLVGPLEARVGLGDLTRVDWNAVRARSVFRHAWTAEHLAWRAQSPTNPIFLGGQRDRGSLLFAKTDRPGIVVVGETDVSIESPTIQKRNTPLFKLFLGMYPKGTVKYGVGMTVPTRLRPSPLNMIFRRLDKSAQTLSSQDVSFNFLDFDAY